MTHDGRSAVSLSPATFVCVYVCVCVRVCDVVTPAADRYFTRHVILLMFLSTITVNEDEYNRGVRTK